MQRVLRGPLGWRLIAVAAAIGLAAFSLWSLADSASEDHSPAWEVGLVLVSTISVVVAVRMWRSCVRVGAHDLTLVGIFRTRRIDAREIKSFEFGDFLGNRAIVVVTERSRHMLPPMSQPHPSKLDALRKWREAAGSQPTS